MKRIVAILLILAYTLPAISMNVSMHYCGGKLASISFFSDNEDGCVCGVKKMKRNCCETKHLAFSFKDSHQKTDFANFTYNSQEQLQLFPDFTMFSKFTCDICSDNSNFNYYDPPIKVSEPLYLLNRVFRI